MSFAPHSMHMLRGLFIGSALMLATFMAEAQVAITTGSYSQDFGSSDVTSWVNNSTYLGWYQSQGTLAGHASITTSAPANAGGFYTYECNGLNDQKIGSRGSGTATLVRYGVVLRNQTGLPLLSLRVSYRGYQMSLAQNGNTVNRTTFDYVTSTGVPAITAAATAAVCPAATRSTATPARVRPSSAAASHWLRRSRMAATSSCAGPTWMTRATTTTWPSMMCRWTST